MIGEKRRRNASFWKWGLMGVIGVLLLAVFAYTAFYLLRVSPPVARLGKQPLPVEVCEATVMDLVETAGATTITAPYAELQVKSEIAGKIKKLIVKVGDTVSPKTLLAYIEDTQYQAALREAESEMKSALEQVRVARVNLDRYTELYREKLISLAELENYQLAMVEAQARFGKADKDLATTKQQLRATQIYSNIHGVVTAQTAHEGEFVDVNAPILTLGQITPIFAQAKIPEEKISAVLLNQEGQVTFDAFPGSIFTGKIYKIDPNSDPNTRVFSAFIELSNVDQALRLGLTGYTRLERKVRALAIPSIAVFDMLSKPTVMVVQNEAVSVRQIVIGGITSGYTWLQNGLAEGEKVVVAGQRYLKEGDHVKVGIR